MPTRIDLQRYKKTYPFLRRQPRYFYLTESDLAAAIIETTSASFNDSDEITYSFTKAFTAAPQVTVTPVGSDANFSVFVSSVSSSSVTVKASTPNNGAVHIHAIQVST